MSYNNNDTNNSLPFQFGFDQQVPAFDPTAAFDPFAPAFVDPTVFDPTTAIDTYNLGFDLAQLQSTDDEKIQSTDAEKLQFTDAELGEFLRQTANWESPALPDLNDSSWLGQDFNSTSNAFDSTPQHVAAPSMSAFEACPLQAADPSMSTFDAFLQQAAYPSMEAFEGLPQQVGAPSMEAFYRYLQHAAGPSSPETIMSMQYMLPFPQAMDNEYMPPNMDIALAAPIFCPPAPVLSTVDLPAIYRAQSEDSSSDTTWYSSSYGASSSSASSPTSLSPSGPSRASSSRTRSSRPSSLRTGSSRSGSSYASHRGKKPYDRITKSQGSGSSKKTSRRAPVDIVEEFSLQSRRRERIQLDPAHEHWVHRIDWDNHPPTWAGVPIPRMPIDEVYWWINDRFKIRNQHTCHFDGCGRVFVGKGMKNHILSKEHLYLRAKCRNCGKGTRPNSYKINHAKTECAQRNPAPAKGGKPAAKRAKLS